MKLEPSVVFKLAKVVSQRGFVLVRNQIFSSLCPFPSIHSSLLVLLHSGVDPTAYLAMHTTCHQIPLKTAVLLVTASNDAKLLARIESEANANLNRCTNRSNWLSYQRLLMYFVLSEHRLHPFVMDYLYHNHVYTYIYITNYYKNPRQLSQLCRLCIRQRLFPNTLVAVKNIGSLPEGIKRYLLFDRSN